MQNEFLAADLQAVGINAKRTLINHVGPYTVDFDTQYGYAVREQGQTLRRFKSFYQLADWLKENAK